MKKFLSIILFLGWAIFIAKNLFAGVKIDYSTIDEFIIAKGADQLISFDLKEVPITQVLKVLAKKSGLNLIIDDSVEDRPVSVYMENVGIKEAIKMVLSAQNLILEQRGDDNLFVVKAKPEEDLVVKIFKLKHATVPGANILAKNSSGGNSDDDSSDGEGGLSGKSLFQAVESSLSERGTAVCDPRTNSIIVKDTPSAIKSITNIINALDVEVPQVTIEVDMLDVSKTVLDEIGVEWSAKDAIFYTGGTRHTSFPLSYKRFPLADMDEISDTIPSVTWNGPTLHMLLTDKRTRYLARPKIFTLSGETANIKIMADEVIGLILNESDSGRLTEEAERTKTGISLDVTPYVNPDTKEIKMVIQPKIIEAKESDMKSYVGNSYRDPEERGIKSVVRIPDGETIVLGGLIKRKKTATKSKVPFFGDILAPLFSARDGDNIDRELLIFITPKILKDFDSMKKNVTVSKNREKEISITLDNISK